MFAKEHITAISTLPHIAVEEPGEGVYEIFERDGMWLTTRRWDNYKWISEINTIHYRGPTQAVLTSDREDTIPIPGAVLKGDCCVRLPLPDGQTLAFSAEWSLFDGVPLCAQRWIYTLDVEATEHSLA